MACQTMVLSKGCARVRAELESLFRFFLLVLYVAPFDNKTQIIMCQWTARLLMTIKWSFAVQFVAAWLHESNVLGETQALFSLIAIMVIMLAQTNKLILILSTTL